MVEGNRIESFRPDANDQMASARDLAHGTHCHRYNETHTHKYDA